MSTPRRRGRPRKEEQVAPDPDALAAALHAFAVHGYQGVSVRTLSVELGVSHNLLHQRYGSKRALWRAAVDWGFGRLVTELTADVDPNSDPLQRLRLFVRRFVAFSARYPDLLRLVNSEGSKRTERLDYLCQTYILPTMATVAPIYQELVDAGRLREVPLTAIYFMITAGGAALFSSEGLATALFGEDVLTAGAVATYPDAVAEFVVRGLQA